MCAVFILGLGLGLAIRTGLGTPPLQPWILILRLGLLNHLLPLKTLPELLLPLHWWWSVSRTINSPWSELHAQDDFCLQYHMKVIINQSVKVCLMLVANEKAWQGGSEVSVARGWSVTAPWDADYLPVDRSSVHSVQVYRAPVVASGQQWHTQHPGCTIHTMDQHQQACPASPSTIPASLKSTDSWQGCEWNPENTCHHRKSVSLLQTLQKHSSDLWTCDKSLHSSIVKQTPNQHKVFPTRNLGYSSVCQK